MILQTNSFCYLSAVSSFSCEMIINKMCLTVPYRFYGTRYSLNATVHVDKNLGDLTFTTILATSTDDKLIFFLFLFFNFVQDTGFDISYNWRQFACSDDILNYGFRDKIRTILQYVVFEIFYFNMSSTEFFFPAFLALINVYMAIIAEAFVVLLYLFRRSLPVSSVICHVSSVICHVSSVICHELLLSMLRFRLVWLWSLLSDLTFTFFSASACLVMHCSCNKSVIFTWKKSLLCTWKYV